MRLATVEMFINQKGIKGYKRETLARGEITHLLLHFEAASIFLGVDVIPARGAR